jgi:diguanylate cyclase (GGDEF)-like protein
MRPSSVRPSNQAVAALTPTKREQLAYWLGHFAQIDLLTELPNRKQFFDRLSRAIDRASRSKQIVGVMLLNLDHFKALNATYGHQIADLVLKKLADRLKECTRESDTMARIDGDEFAVVLESLTEKEDAAITAQRLLAALAGPIHLESLVIEVTATVGAAFYPSDAQNVDTLLQNAEVAMCHGKERKRNHCQFYSPTLHLETRRDQLRRAKVEQGYARLTPREREVLHILVAGSANKMIAYMLGTSTRTIENHRAKIMDKMDARSLPELVRMVLGRQGPESGPPKRQHGVE